MSKSSFNQKRIYDAAYYILMQEEILTTDVLQELLYYSNCYNLIWNNEPLFNDKFTASQDGPINEELANFLISENAVTKNFFLEVNPKVLFSDKEKAVIDIIVKCFGKYNGARLQWISKNELPWAKARKREDLIIQNEDIREYYNQVLKEGVMLIRGGKGELI